MPHSRSRRRCSSRKSSHNSLGMPRPPSSNARSRSSSSTRRSRRCQGSSSRCCTYSHTASSSLGPNKLDPPHSNSGSSSTSNRAGERPQKVLQLLLPLLQPLQQQRLLRWRQGRRVRAPRNYLERQMDPQQRTPCSSSLTNRVRVVLGALHNRPTLPTPGTAVAAVGGVRPAPRNAAAARR